jgi:hypothetical protein
MKWKAQNKTVSKVAVNPAKYPGEQFDASGPLPLPMGRKEYWLKLEMNLVDIHGIISCQRSHQQQQFWKGNYNGWKLHEYVLKQSDVIMWENKWYMCWENGVMVEYIAPYTPQHNGQVERQFPTDMKRADAMLDTVKLSVAQTMKLWKEGIQYASTMATVSIKDSKSPYEKFFGVPSPITPETCVNFGRIGYVTYENIFKNKYKPRAFKCHIVGYAMNHSAHK